MTLASVVEASILRKTRLWKALHSKLGTAAGPTQALTHGDVPALGVDWVWAGLPSRPSLVPELKYVDLVRLLGRLRGARSVPLTQIRVLGLFPISHQSKLTLLSTASAGSGSLSAPGARPHTALCFYCSLATFAQASPSLPSSPLTCFLPLPPIPFFFFFLFF